MKVISMSMVGNESEIIESFIRYNSNFVDEMLFVSSCCIDNTTRIIRNLKKEGYAITLIELPQIDYDQRRIDYKYMKEFVNMSDADWFINLDVDEFLIGDTNPREILKSLSMDRVYEVNWKNYAMTEKDNLDELFIPKRLVYAKQNFAGNSIPKVILPVNLIKKNNIVMETGHHHVFGEDIIVEHLDKIQLAHYPVTSCGQYMFKIYGNRLKFTVWTNRGNWEGSHQNKQIAEIEAGTDIYKIAYSYGLGSNLEMEMTYDPIDLQYCDGSNMEIKYGDLVSKDFNRNIMLTGQMMGLKVYQLELEKKLDNSLKSVLVFGAGKSSDVMFNGLPEKLVNLKAYIDNDISKAFTMFQHRLVIPPEWVHFFTYDKIIISNFKYYSEMKKQLIELGVEKEKIESVNYLMELSD